MLLSSNFILNNAGEPHSYILHPFISQFCNNYKREDQLCAVTVPDVDVSSLLEGSDFSMVAGDFLECYVTESK